MHDSLTKAIDRRAFGFRKIEALFQDKLVEFEIGDDLIQPLVLFLERLQFRELLPPHTTGLFAPVIVRRFTHRGGPPRRRNICTTSQM